MSKVIYDRKIYDQQGEHANLWAEFMVDLSISQVEPIAECHLILEAACAVGGPAVNGPARYLGRLGII